MPVSIGCAIGIERFMRTHMPPDEVATLVYAHNTDKNQAIADYHEFFRSDKIENELRKLQRRRLLRLERIIEGAVFSKKSASSLLQIADACAYIFGRWMRGAGVPNEFYIPLRRQLQFGNRTIMSDTNGL
jgi:hypothetical protein